MRRILRRAAETTAGDAKIASAPATKSGMMAFTDLRTVIRLLRQKWVPKFTFHSALISASIAPTWRRIRESSLFASRTRNSRKLLHASAARSPTSGRSSRSSLNASTRLANSESIAAARSALSDNDRVRLAPGGRCRPGSRRSAFSWRRRSCSPRLSSPARKTIHRARGFVRLFRTSLPFRVRDLPVKRRGPHARKDLNSCIYVSRFAFAARIAEAIVEIGQIEPIERDGHLLRVHRTDPALRLIAQNDLGGKHGRPQADLVAKRGAQMVILPGSFLERADHRPVGLPELHAATKSLSDSCDRIAFVIVPAGGRRFDLGGKLVNENDGELVNAGEVDIESGAPDLRALHELVHRETGEAVRGDVRPGGVDDFPPRLLRTSPALRRPRGF